MFSVRWPAKQKSVNGEPRDCCPLVLVIKKNGSYKLTSGKIRFSLRIARHVITATKAIFHKIHFILNCQVVLPEKRKKNTVKFTTNG